MFWRPVWGSEKGKAQAAGAVACNMSYMYLTLAHAVMITVRGLEKGLVARRCWAAPRAL